MPASLKNHRKITAVVLCYGLNNLKGNLTFQRNAFPSFWSLNYLSSGFSLLMSLKYDFNSIKVFSNQTQGKKNPNKQIKVQIHF